MITTINEWKKLNDDAPDDIYNDLHDRLEKLDDASVCVDILKDFYVDNPNGYEDLQVHDLDVGDLYYTVVSECGKRNFTQVDIDDMINTYFGLDEKY